MKPYEKVQSIIKEKNIDAILVTDEYNRRYISGFTGSTGALFITKQRQVLITDFRYVEQVSRECPEFQCFDAKDKTYVEVLNQLMEEENLGILAFEEESISLKDYKIYEEKGIQKEFVPIGNGITSLRVIKEPWEIERLKEAEHIGDIAFERVLEIIKPGMTEKEVSIELEFTMKRNGASGLSFDSIVASGVNSALPHAHPTDKVIEYGDFVTMDFGCIYKGYCSDMTRTIVVGKANEEQKKIYGIVLKAQLEVLDQVKIGMNNFDVDKIARDIIEEQYKGRFGHGLGHSLGLYIHEEPRFSPKCHEILKAGMVMTVEPGIYIPGFGGVRIEDVIVMNEHGYENLTHSPKELIELI